MGKEHRQLSDLARSVVVALALSVSPAVAAQQGSTAGATVADESENAPKAAADGPAVAAAA